MFKCPNCKEYTITTRQRFVDTSAGNLACAHCGARLERRNLLAAVLVGAPIPLIFIPLSRHFDTGSLAIDLVTLGASMLFGLGLALILPLKIRKQ